MPKRKSKPTAIKRRKKRKDRSQILTYISWSLAIMAIILSSLIGGYYLGYGSAVEDVKDVRSYNKKIAQEEKIISVNERLKEILERESQKVTKVHTKKALPKLKESYKSASHEYDSLSTPPKRLHKKVIGSSDKKAKLAIIIDDVSSSSHVHAINSLGLNLTMSFLPPSKARPSSAKLASKEKFYMVHLPMEARNYTAEEPLTLRVRHSQSDIDNRIVELKKLFPKVKYLNNHTGSTFTSDIRAMDRLISSLNQNRINFIDSRTTAKTKAPTIMKKYNKKYVARDIFLDHRHDKAYVKEQIKKAIAIAKREGSAIAIGHPHKNTILALKESKNLLKEVDIVYVNRLY